MVIRRALRDQPADRWPDLTAKDLMTTDPITIRPDDLAAEALNDGTQSA